MGGEFQVTKGAAHGSDTIKYLIFFPVIRAECVWFAWLAGCFILAIDILICKY